MTMTERKYQAGYYRARGIAGTGQHGYAEGGGEQISLELDVHISDQNIVRLTTILPFAGGALAVSIERLKALGWDGSNDPQLRGIDANEVDVEIKYEPKRDKPNEERMVVEIKTNGGRFKFKKPMAEPEKRGFMAKLAEEAKRLGAGNGASRPATPPPTNDPTSFPHGANAPQQHYKL